MSGTITTILAMDDEALIRETISIYLENRGFRVLQAANGREGVEMFAKERPDLLLLDLRMPEMDGLEAMDHIRELDPDVPCIVVSGTGILGDAINALKRGAWDYVLKPIEDMAILGHAVDKALERARLFRENACYQRGLEAALDVRTADLRQARQRLEEQNLFLTTLIESIPNPVFYKDASGRYLGCNQGFLRLLDLDRENIIGHTGEALFPAEQAGVFQHTDEEILGGLGERTYEIDFVPPSGVPAHLAISKAAFRDGTGQVAGLVGVISDMTAHNQLEAEIRHSLKEKNLLLREIHHRVKNNLQLILSLMVLQADEIVDTGEIERSRRLEYRIRSMALVHEQLYNSSDLATIDMQGYIASLAGSIASHYKDKANLVRLDLDTASLRLDIDKSVPCGLVLNELLTNAYHHAFSPGQSGALRVVLRQSGDHIHLSVADNGRGLPPGLTVDTAQTLGLVLVRELTRQLHGVLRVTADQGTRFDIVFPVA